MNSPVLTGFADSIAGWVTCGDDLTTTGLPTNLYADNCASNGISWQVEYLDTYLSTEPLFEQNALSYAISHCNASIYDTICDRVGSLPPYICSRKVYLPFFTVFGTAIANAHILMVLLFIMVGWTMSAVKTKDALAGRVEKDNENNILLSFVCIRNM